ncbi:alpha/beta fold hydrolase, partial [Nonomuraea sp. NPDC004297]
MTSRAAANGIEIAYESFGSPDGRPLLLIMGLGAQLIQWDEGLCELLADQGHHVIRFDNRDAGLSTHFHDHGPPVPGAAP